MRGLAAGMLAPPYLMMAILSGENSFKKSKLFFNTVCNRIAWKLVKILRILVSSEFLNQCLWGLRMCMFKNIQGNSDEESLSNIIYQIS
jgi:hypothetical protein